ncbi:MAG: hypothetical protein LCH57_10105 [Proteobacteria bacterium]|nr:hypothetical protein [Pseudomonadota bacterium]
MPICFRDAIVGNSKHGSWYTYGFLEPQGPIANKTVSGLMLRDVASYLMKRFHLPVWNENAIRGIVGDLKGLVEDNRRKGRRDILSKSISDHHFITVFSRKIDRIITNEDDLVRVLSRVYGLEVRYVRIEDAQGRVCAQGVTEWVLVDAATLRPQRIPPAMLTVFETTSADS